jgi:DNA-binding GntR family transcriptional regulator
MSRTTDMPATKPGPRRVLSVIERRAAPQAATGMPLQQIEFAPLHERVYAEIRDALIAGKFEPGHRMTVRGLASALGTSVMPVRAALTRLVAERALAQPDKRVVIVPVVARETFRDLMETRMLLEGQAAAQASMRMQPADLATTKRLARDLDNCIERDNIVDYLQVNRALKFSIYVHCDSPTLISLIETLWLQVGPFLRHLATDIKGLVLINYHHDAIAALEQHDGRKARAWIRRDIREGMLFLLRTAEFAPDDGAPSRIRSTT